MRCWLAEFTYTGQPYPYWASRPNRTRFHQKIKGLKGLLKTGWWFQIFFYFHPCLGKITILKKYFSKGLKPPTRITRKENKQRSQFYFPDWKNQTEEHFVSIFLVVFFVFSPCFRENLRTVASATFEFLD